MDRYDEIYYSPIGEMEEGMAPEEMLTIQRILCRECMAMGSL